MKKISKNVSPFLLLMLPLVIVLSVMAFHAETETVLEKIQLSASFIKIPEIDIIHVFFAR